MGLTGLVQFLPNGDREPFYDVVNFRNETNQTLLIGSWSQVSGLNLTLAPEFWSGSTTPPGTIVDHRVLIAHLPSSHRYSCTDLDVRPPYNYWSCFDKVERTDPTGYAFALSLSLSLSLSLLAVHSFIRTHCLVNYSKKVPLERPDFGNPNNINSTYICDGMFACHARTYAHTHARTHTHTQTDKSTPRLILPAFPATGFLDCNNMSDEWDCAVSMPVVFVVFGIITGILFLIPILVFLPFTIIFGFIYPRSRVRQASPEFLLVMILACCLGYGSTYAWYAAVRVQPFPNQASR